MKNLMKRVFGGALALALVGGSVFLLPVNSFAKPKQNITVDVTVRVHGSDVGVSPEVMEKTVERLLEAAEIHVVPDGDGEGIIELEIDIYKNDGGGFRVDCDWDDDDEAEEQERAETQEAIDGIVETFVEAFLAFIKSN